MDKNLKMQRHLVGQLRMILAEKIFSDYKNSHGIVELKAEILSNMEVKKAATHDINSILKYKNKYMGNSYNYTNLFGHLPISNIEKSLKLFPDELKLAVNYKVTVNI